MNFNAPFIRDRRRRFYRPVSRVLFRQGVENAEVLIGNLAYQPVIHFLPPAVTVAPGGSLLLDFGSSFHGGVRLNVGSSGGCLRVKFGESVSEAVGASNQDCSRRDAVLELPICGTLEYGNTVFRFVEIVNEGEKPVSFFNVMGVALECDLETTGFFDSSDARLNEIWRTAVRTVHLCMQDYLYDGAKRDRIVWMGDMHPEIKGVLCAFSDISIIRDSFEFLMAQAGPEEPMNNIYTYSCWFIISVWDYFLATGDRDFLEKHADYFERMLIRYTSFIGGDGAETVPERRFLDWPNNDDPAAKHAGIQALMLWMMQAGEKILRELGRETAPVVAAREKLLRHIPDPAGRKAPAALMTLTRLADRSDVLRRDPFRDVSTFYGYYMLQAQPTPSALELIRRYWGGMLDLGATSFWEDFDLSWSVNAGRIDELPVPGKADIHADFGAHCYKGLRHSLSHGWSCGPAPFLSERVLGVRFLAPGGTKVAIRPDLGDLAFVRGGVPTPRGVITVEADRSGKCEISLPDGVTAV